MSLMELRQLVLRTLQDCSGTACERLRLRVDCAREPLDLWLMRCDIVEVLTEQKPDKAASRMEELLPALEGRMGILAAL